MHEYYSIQELTREFSITARTLRYYEDVGLLVPFRRGRVRLYTPSDRSRLQRILRAKRLNFSLEQISDLLAVTSQPSSIPVEIEKQIAHLHDMRAKLRKMQQEIKDAHYELDRVEEICFERLAELRVNR
ncbi:MerR family transcriptional regulator [Bartonella sp. DGB2]|uniref:MerR family transcriptional regulator n=1 Tax=Bartonella sp. DGB2 TaxID=3388426 RepID=UPI00399025D0